ALVCCSHRTDLTRGHQHAGFERQAWPQTQDQTARGNWPPTTMHGERCVSQLTLSSLSPTAFLELPAVALTAAVDLTAAKRRRGQARGAGSRKEWAAANPCLALTQPSIHKLEGGPAWNANLLVLCGFDKALPYVQCLLLCSRRGAVLQRSTPWPTSAWQQRPPPPPPSAQCAHPSADSTVTFTVNHCKPPLWPPLLPPLVPPARPSPVPGRHL
ncbi:hypothetical protein EDB80DRAFT_820188, partial [Ilyonectria destructans]